jgi:hypothetical protein
MKAAFNNPTGVAKAGGSDEKYGAAALAYLHEPVRVGDPNKMYMDVVRERVVALSYERLAIFEERRHKAQVERCVAVLNEALDAVPDEFLEEATLINSDAASPLQQPPALTPPVPDYLPAFGFDVPVLRTNQREFPSRRNTMEEFSTDLTEWPLVSPQQVEQLTQQEQQRVESVHSRFRAQAPTTGVEGESFEAYFALEKRALNRQKLILDLHNDDSLREKFEADDGFAAAERERRGILPLEVDERPYLPALEAVEGDFKGVPFRRF